MKTEIRQILNENPGRSIFLTGPVNSGKTSAMKAVLSEMDFKPNLSTYEPFELNHAPLHQLTGKTLFLDGLCTQEAVFDLLLMRLNKNMQTFVTSDINPEEIPSHYWQKIQSRMTVINLWPESSPSSPGATPGNTNIFSSLLKFIQK